MARVRLDVDDSRKVRESGTRNWKGVEMREVSLTGEGESEDEVHSGFVAVNGQTEREEKRRWGCRGKRAVRVGSRANQLGGTEKISR